MTKLDKLIKEVEELVEEYQAKVKAGIVRNIPLHNGYSANQQIGDRYGKPSYCKGWQ